MFCAISGRVPIDPVFCPKTGFIYERSLIQKSLSLTGKCPLTDKPLDSSTDLFQLNYSQQNKAEKNKPTEMKSLTSVKPFKATSIPELLKAMRSEWDGVMLETFESRKQLKMTKEELVRTLYERDAACRVIARFIKENERLNKALVNGSNKRKVEANEGEAENSSKKVKLAEKAEADEEQLKEPERYDHYHLFF